MDDLRAVLERVARRIPPPSSGFDHLWRVRARRVRSRRVAAGAVAFALVIGGSAALLVALRSGRSSPPASTTPRPPTASEILWPHRNGLACCQDATSAARSFALVVLGWKAPIASTCPTGDGTGCPSALPQGQSVYVFDGCSRCPFIVANLREFPGGGTWVVTDVAGPQLRISVEPGSSIAGGSEITIQSDLPDGTRLVAGYGYEAGCGGLGFGAGYRTVKGGVATFRVASRGLRCSSGISSRPGPLQRAVTGYVWVMRAPARGVPVGPNLLFGSTDTPPHAPANITEVAAVQVRFVPGT